MLDGMLQGLRILVAEDEYFLADELHVMLKDAGAEMLGPVASVGGGLLMVEEGKPFDAASLDVNLGGETVYPLADVLIERGVPFLFTTGYDQAAIPAAYAHIRRLEKPVEPETVVMEIGKLLRF